MRPNKSQQVQLLRWRGGQHPTLELMKQHLTNEGMRPFRWHQHANYRFGVRSHGFDKTLYCVEGSVEVILPDLRQCHKLNPGDRVDIPKGIRHSITVGRNGATCLEGTPNTASASVSR